MLTCFSFDCLIGRISVLRGLGRQGWQPLKSLEPIFALYKFGDGLSKSVAALGGPTATHWH